MWYIYRYMIEDQWIYVGKSESNITQRICEHASDPRFAPYKDAKVTFIKVGSRSNMDATELMLIKLMHPVLNYNDTTDMLLPFSYDGSKVEWIDYETSRPFKYVVASDKTWSVSEERLNLFLDQRFGEEEYTIYTGISYGSYKIPRDEVYEAFSIPKIVRSTTVASRLNAILTKCAEKYKREIICGQDTSNSTFYFHVYLQE